ncbi:MAG: alpha/beta hydrolase [Roseburia sp.]|nr:alpha/beta hydrolase [Roseburia sp.]
MGKNVRKTGKSKNGRQVKTKTDVDGRKGKIKPRSCLFRLLSFVLMAVVVILSGISYYIVYAALSPSKSSRNVKETYSYMYSEYPFLKSWVRSLDRYRELRDTTIYAADSVLLHAVYIRAGKPTRNTAVIIHGHKSNAIGMLHIAYMYHHDMGFNVLLPDLRGHGKSGGTHIQMGWNDRKDVLLWMNVANALFGDDTRMVVHGISMGAATAMMVSGEKQPPFVKAYVEDCGYTSVWDEICYVAERDYGLSDMPFVSLASLICQWKYGWNFKEASCVGKLRHADTPMFFIHGTADTYVPAEMVYTLYQAKPRNKHIWTVPGVMHARSYHDCREEYTRRVSAFVNMYFYNE